MASTVGIFSFFVSLSIRKSAINPAKDVCPVKFCGPHGPEIRFPFRASGFHAERCGYPGFNLVCNSRGQAILRLRSSQDFVVDRINYEEQYIVLKDQRNCLARRLRNTTFSRSVSVAQEYRSFTFANCSVNLSAFGIEWVGCLSHGHHTVHVAPTGSFTWLFAYMLCRTWTVSVPSPPLQHPANITESVVLRWDAPDCRSCEKSVGRCRLKGSAGFDVGCFGKQSKQHGLSKRAKLGILLGVMLPLLLCTSGLAFYLSSRSQGSRHRNPRDQTPHGNNGAADITSPSSPSRETQRASNVVVGINSVAMESYPKIQVDDDGQVPRPDDDICAICLSEYQPKETHRTIPKCGHYFHAQCIDQWLERNASCPMCRDPMGYM